MLLRAKNKEYNFFFEDLEQKITNNVDLKSFKTWACFGPRGLGQFLPEGPEKSCFDLGYNMCVEYFGEKAIKDPLPSKYTKRGTDGNIVFQGSTFAAGGHNLEEYDKIIEIGGGYGALANIILESGKFNGEYVIYDFELMERVYRTYINKHFTYVSDPISLVPGKKTLVVAFWSLSEMPSELIQMIIDSVKPCDFHVITSSMANYYHRQPQVYFKELLGVESNELNPNRCTFIGSLT